METLEEAVCKYEAGMTVEAARYLLDRGLTQETVRTRRLGVVVDPMPGHEAARGYIAIPFTLKGQIVAIRFRNLGQEGPKYLQPSGSRIGVYNVDAIHQAAHVLHITEGEFDAMILNQVGLPAIGFPGASTWRGHHGRMLAGFNRLWVWGDPDGAGAEFVQKVTNRLPRSAKGVKLSIGDVTETYLAGGAKFLYSLVEGEAA
jgi:DNA primase